MSVAHDKILGHIAIYNDYKFAAYPYSTLQKFIVDNEVIITIHFEMFPPGTVRKLYTRHIRFYRVLRRIVSITHELDITWYPGISPIFIREDSTLSDACASLDVPPIVIDPSKVNFTSAIVVQTCAQM